MGHVYIPLITFGAYSLHISTLQAMGEKKVTKMIIRGDLQCYKCSKKIKKTLCQIPQIQDQEYDEKNNKVMIVVVCCNPEKVRDRICSKACGSIESIEIVEEKQPKVPKKQPQNPKEPKDCEQPPEKTIEVIPTQPKHDPPPPSQQIIPVPVPSSPKPKPPPVPKPIKLVPMSAFGCPPVFYPVMWYPCYFGCRGPCYHGRIPLCPDGCGRPARECMCPDGRGRLAHECLAREGMCLDGCGRLSRECMCPDGCGRPVNECRGSNRGYYVNRCDYFSEENANACTIM